MKMTPLVSILAIGATSAVALAFSATISSAIYQSPSIEELLKTGWQIAGYSQAFDNRSTFILFRNPDQSYLVQCRVGYDVTRTPSAYSLCYKLPNDRHRAGQPPAHASAMARRWSLDGSTSRLPVLALNVKIG